MQVTHAQAKKALFLLPFLLYQDSTLGLAMILIGLVVMYIEKIGEAIGRLEWREYLFFIYMFHMLFGEREFAYVGFEPLFITEIVLAGLAVSYAKELLSVRKGLFVYYLLVLIGLGFALIYLGESKLDAIRDSFMLLYAIWVPIVYHVFRGKRHYDLFFQLLKIFIVLKGVAYLYEAVMIVAGLKAVTFEGFRFGVGYILPSMIVLTIFLPFRHIGLRYKVIALLMVPAVFTIFHRSIFLGIMLAVALMFLVGSTITRKKILAYGTLSLVLLISFLVYYNSVVDVNLFQILEYKTSLDEGNINYRVISWQHILDKFYEHFLLGYGVGKPVMFWYQDTFYTSVELTYFEIRDLDGNAQPHNSYLNILTRFGILLLQIFCFAIFHPLGRVAGYVRFKYSTSQYAYSKFLLLAGFLLVMYVLAFFNVVLEGPHHSFPFWLAIGMLLAFGQAGNFSPTQVRFKTLKQVE